MVVTMETFIVIARIQNGCWPKNINTSSWTPFSLRNGIQPQHAWNTSKLPRNVSKFYCKKHPRRDIDLHLLHWPWCKWKITFYVLVGNSRQQLRWLWRLFLRQQLPVSPRQQRHQIPTHAKPDVVTFSVKWQYGESC